MCTLLASLQGAQHPFAHGCIYNSDWPLPLMLINMFIKDFNFVYDMITVILILLSRVCGFSYKRQESSSHLVIKFRSVVERACLFIRSSLLFYLSFFFLCRATSWTERSRSRSQFPRQNPDNPRSFRDEMIRTVSASCYTPQPSLSCSISFLFFFYKIFSRRLDPHQLKIAGII